MGLFSNSGQNKLNYDDLSEFKETDEDMPVPLPEGGNLEGEMANMSDMISNQKGRDVKPLHLPDLDDLSENHNEKEVGKLNKKTTNKKSVNKKSNSKVSPKSNGDDRVKKVEDELKQLKKKLSEKTENTKTDDLKKVKQENAELKKEIKKLKQEQQKLAKSESGAMPKTEGTKLRNDIKKLKDDLQELQKIVKNDKRVTACQERLKTLEKELRSHSKEEDKRLSTIEKSFDKYVHNDSFHELKRLVNSLIQEVKNVLSSDSDYKKKQEELQKQTQKNFDSVRSEISGVDKKIEDNSKRIEKLENHFYVLKERVGYLKGKK